MWQIQILNLDFTTLRSKLTGPCPVKSWDENLSQNTEAGSWIGLCDMDKKYISRFFDFFFDFDFNHDFDTNRHALSYTSCFCTSCLALFFILLHILLFISFFYLYICSCAVLLLYNFYSLHCPLSGPDLIYISLLIIPCIIYHVT